MFPDSGGRVPAGTGMSPRLQLNLDSISSPDLYAPHKLVCAYTIALNWEYKAIAC